MALLVNACLACLGSFPSAAHKWAVVAGILEPLWKRGGGVVLSDKPDAHRTTVVVYPMPRGSVVVGVNWRHLTHADFKVSNFTPGMCKPQNVWPSSRKINKIGFIQTKLLGPVVV